MNIRFLVLMMLGFVLVGPAAAFSLQDVSIKAEALAKKGYEEPKDNLPKVLKDLSYEQYHDIHFKPEKALWHTDKLPFEIELFHPGLYFKYPVSIKLVDAHSVKTLHYDASAFDFGKNTFDAVKLGDVGYAGFRAHFAVNSKARKDEVTVFLGASYFRGLGKGQRYGLSARGLAVDTGEMSGEEYPNFTEFWIEKPMPDAKQLVVYALLDSRRVTGAYRFSIHPGAETYMDVQSRLYPREKVSKLGIAPLTSMFFYGENQHPTTDDYRPEVHDSDGLSVLSDSGEWIWRPLVNPKRLLVSSFGLNNPRGFGLMQRDRDFADYQDVDGRYDRRPSAWVVPKGNWGTGRVELIQIPSPDETNNNIIAFWVPEQPVQPGQPLSFQYRLSWQRDPLTLPPNAWTVQSRRGHGRQTDPEDSIRFMIDFAGPQLKKLKSDAPPEASVWVGAGGELLEQQLIPNEAIGGYRLALRMRRTRDDQPVELRASLRDGSQTISETWSYLLPPER